MSAARIIFAGTPDFALASLTAMVEAGFVPVAVLTQPDRPAGRGKKLTASPVKKFALARDIPVLQPVTLKDPEMVEKIAALRPDLMVVAAYGLLLPQAVLDVPVRGCLNVHASLLPRWRGASPIQQAILHGDEMTGVCLMQMEAGLDTGPVYVAAKTPIVDDESAGQLHDRLAGLGGGLLTENLNNILAGNIEPVAQDENIATYAGKIRRQDAAIDWTGSATDIVRAIRAYNPVPGAWFRLDTEDIKCWQASVLEGVDGTAGVILDAGKAGIDVACGEGAVRLLDVQRPGRGRVSGGEFAAQANFPGKRLS
jgi:methionyl-tRNA formyltransferase